MLSRYLRKNLFDRLDAWKSGSRRVRYWRHLEKTQYLPEEELRRIQWERMRAILQHAYERNPYYRGKFVTCGLTPADITRPQDIKEIPILAKEEVRNNLKGMLSRGYSENSLLKFKTGGSTGKSLELYLTEECSELRNACARRSDRWSGWDVGEPIGALWGNPVLPTDLKSRLRNALVSPYIFLDTMSLNRKSVEEFAKEWRRVRPTLMFGHAHSIFMLAGYVEDLMLDAIRPRTIISTSMMLIPSEREYIEKVFGVKVFDRYGCEEVSLIGSECEKHDGMHMNIEHLYVEFIAEDGRDAKDGEPGRIVVTDLMNFAMPFIRYQVEDIGVPKGGRCSCGRGLPLMGKVSGRIADFLIKRDGTRVAGVSLIENTLTRIPGINQMQIIQEAIDRISLNIVRASTFCERNREEMILYFKDVFGPNVQIEWNDVERILPERSGKYRFTICNVNSGGRRDG